MSAIILDAATTDQGIDCWDGLRALLPGLTVHARTASGDVVARCLGRSVVLTNKAKLTADHLAQLPDLRYIGVMATGTNIVDLAAAKERGIVVTNVPGYSTMSVAQLVWALVLHLTHDAAGHDAEVKAGRWAAGPDFAFFRQPLTELAGKTLAVVGMGAIGGAVARIGEALGMRVMAAAVPGSTTPGRTPLPKALAEAQVVTLHCPLTPATQGMMSAATLAAMRPGAILINTGRGPLIDNRAVVEALATGHLGGIGLDVLPQEPPPQDEPLLAALAANPPWARRVVITPHIAWGTVEARRRLVAELEANVAAFQRGESRHRV